jgi:hypothetical protein
VRKVPEFFNFFLKIQKKVKISVFLGIFNCCGLADGLDRLYQPGCHYSVVNFFIAEIL